MELKTIKPQQNISKLQKFIPLRGGWCHKGVIGRMAGPGIGCLNGLVWWIFPPYLFRYLITTWKKVQTLASVMIQRSHMCENPRRESRNLANPSTTMSLQNSHGTRYILTWKTLDINCINSTRNSDTWKLRMHRTWCDSKVERKYDSSPNSPDRAHARNASLNPAWRRPTTCTNASTALTIQHFRKKGFWAMSGDRVAEFS